MKRFVELTLSDHCLCSNVLLNIAHIMDVTEDSDGMCIVKTSDGQLYFVKENYTQVKKLIHRSLCDGD